MVGPAVIGGHTQDENGTVRPTHDAAAYDVASGEVATIPAGPLVPRGRPLCAIVGDRLYVLWGTVVHALLADGASYRLR